MDTKEVLGFINRTNIDDAHVKEQYLKAAKMLGSVIEENPEDSRYYWILGDCYRHMGRERDALLCFQKAYSLVDFQKIRPDRLVKRSGGITETVRHYILSRVGSCPYTVLGSSRKTSDGAWDIPIAYDWKSLRGPGRDIEKKLYFPCGSVRITTRGKILDVRAAELFRILRKSIYILSYLRRVLRSCRIK